MPDRRRQRVLDRTASVVNIAPPVDDLWTSPPLNALDQTTEKG